MKPSKQAGYTLIELLLYVMLIGILLSAVTYFYGTTVDARVKNRTITEVDEQGTAAMDYMTQTIRNASSITTPAAAGSGASLTLVVPTGSLSPTIFSLSGTTLQVTEGAGGAVALTSSDVQISSLNFKNLSRSGTAGIVQISFTANRINPSGRNEYDYQRSFISSAELKW